MKMADFAQFLLPICRQIMSVGSVSACNLLLGYAANSI